jgi:hypothetical protein
MLMVGCGEEETTLSPTLQPPLPQNNTPEGAIQRFIATYERKDSSEYTRLFTGDFLFEFSNSADPDLANEYSAGWFKEDERISANNLFHGGVNNDGVFQDAAQSINLDLITTTTQGDTTSGRDPTKFRLLYTPITLTIHLPPSVDDPEGTTFVIGGADPVPQRFFLVRGDAATGLNADQPADSLHWFMWFWRDESIPGYGPESRPGGRNSPWHANDATWGRLKALFR